MNFIENKYLPDLLMSCPELLYVTVLHLAGCTSGQLHKNKDQKKKKKKKKYINFLENKILIKKYKKKKNQLFML